MWSSIEGDNLKAVKCLGQHDHEFRSLDDLRYCADIEHANVQGAESRWKATQRRVVFIGEGLRLRLRRRLIQTSERLGLRRTPSAAPRRRRARRRTPPDIGATPPDSGEIWMAVSRARHRS